MLFRFLSTRIRLPFDCWTRVLREVLWQDASAFHDPESSRWMLSAEARSMQIPTSPNCRSLLAKEFPREGKRVRERQRISAQACVFIFCGCTSLHKSSAIIHPGCSLWWTYIVALKVVRSRPCKLQPRLFALPCLLSSSTSLAGIRVLEKYKVRSSISEPSIVFPHSSSDRAQTRHSI